MISAVAALFLFVAGTAAAQVDDRALALLQGLVPADMGPVETTSMTVETTMYIEGQVMTTVSKTAVDYVNQRVASITTLEGMEVTLLLQDGQVTMSMFGMELPAPDGMGDSLADSLTQQPGTDPFESLRSATFDGPVDYDGLLAGDQVTVDSDGSLYGAPEGDSTVMQYVFDASGALLGMHVETDDGGMLMVYEEPVTGANLLGNMNMYMNQDGEWTLFSEMVYKDVTFNEPIDESLFN